MSEAQALYRLQTIDLSIEETQQMLRDVESKLGETDELIEARKRLGETEARVHAIQTTLRDAEDKIEDLVAKIKPLETKLYAGTVKNPKELTALEKDVEMYRKMKSGIEDKVIDLMAELEEWQADLDKMRSEVSVVQERWEQSQKTLLQERDVARARLEDLKAQRAAIAAAISPEAIQTYESLRKSKKGRAVAKVEQNTCQGCRVALPMNEVQRARSNPNLAFCSTCGRIIWVAR